jgi:hypothetical protein
MKIQHMVVELDHANLQGPPVFDIQVPPQMPNVPARAVFVYGRVERGAIVSKSQQLRLMTCVVFACDPDLAPETRRLLLLTPSGHIPEEIADEVLYLGSFLHPGNGFPIAVYEAPWSPVVEEAVEPDEKFDTTDEAAIDAKHVDVLAAINAVRDREPADDDVEPYEGSFCEAADNEGARIARETGGES